MPDRDELIREILALPDYVVSNLPPINKAGFPIDLRVRWKGPQCHELGG